MVLDCDRSKEVPMIDFEQWEGFEGRIWKEEVNVRDFIQKNYTPLSLIHI